MRAFFTLATPEYVRGAAVLIKSMRLQHSTFDFNVLALGLSKEDKYKLIEVGAKTIIDVEKITSIRAKHLTWHNNLHFADNCFAKLHLWSLTNYEQIAYLDADMIVVKNIDELLYEDHQFAAAPNFYQKYERQTDIPPYQYKLVETNFSTKDFSAGMFVLRPDEATFKSLMHWKDQPRESHEDDVTDQGLLNKLFGSQFTLLDPTYNMSRRCFQVWREKWDELNPSIKIIHYTVEKPWMKENPHTKQLDMLWHVYDRMESNGH
jgi:lipopolysaccharide biosynthesis glycosyltransferase